MPVLLIANITIYAVYWFITVYHSLSQFIGLYCLLHVYVIKNMIEK